ncbi:MAG: hypothetical protein JRN67_11920, partial [Nitrososphaerota archaeon]|nr:hypothetical protein [Nitrososphaerota archaeon]
MASHGPRRIRVHRIGYHRKGYKRKAFTEHRDGKTIHEPATNVAPANIPPTNFMEKDSGLPGHGPPSLPKIVHHDRLIRLGYHASKSEDERHESLRKAVHEYGKRSVLGMLRWQINIRENSHPDVRHRFEEDFEYVARNF